jgi:hypothetical protein
VRQRQVCITGDSSASGEQVKKAGPQEETVTAGQLPGEKTSQSSRPMTCDGEVPVVPTILLLCYDDDDETCCRSKSLHRRRRSGLTAGASSLRRALFHSSASQSVRTTEQFLSIMSRIWGLLCPRSSPPTPTPIRAAMAAAAVGRTKPILRCTTAISSR